MRIRNLKPEFWRSDDVTRLAFEHRLLFIGLWSYADDNGVGADRVVSIAADLFAEDLARDSHAIRMLITCGLQALNEGGQIVRYEAAGKRLLYITNWTRHQYIPRPTKGHCYPLPPAEMIESARSITACHMRTTCESHVNDMHGTGGQGDRGTGGSLSDPADSYERARDDSAERETTPAIDLDPSGAVVPAGHAEYPMILIPDDWQPDDLTRAKHPRPDIEAQADAFRDHARAVGRRCHGPAGWNAAFSSWLRKNPPPGQGAATTKARGWVDLVADLAPTDPDTHPDQKAIR